MFIKYPSIENHYREKQINKFIKDNPDVDFNNVCFVIMEKLDGTNIQFIFKPEQEMRVASRNQLTSFEFYNVGKAIEDEPKMKELFDYVKEYSNKNDVTIHIYGELFGQGIQKRIDYGKPKFRIFDMRINGEFLSFDEMISFFKKLSNHFHYRQFCVPIVVIVDGIKNALNFDIENVKSFYNKKEIVEGVVIKPFFEELENRLGKRLIIKKKSEKFQEFMKQGPKKEKVKPSKDVKEWHKSFEQYINKNRVLSLISKEGPIDSKEKIGKYIGMIIQDAREDFLKDNEDVFPEFEKKELKYIFNVGSLVFKHLNEFIEV